MTTPTDLLAAQLRRDGSRPLLTYYNDATGERVELSVATTANWVAKTANYLVDDRGVDDGDLVSVVLPLHWQATIVLLAAWAAGAQVGFDAGGVVTFTTEATNPSDSTVLLTLGPMGADFSRLVAAQPDAFVPLSPAGDDLVAAAPIDVPNGARVLTVLPYDETGAVGYGLIAPLAVDGSIVMVRNPDPDRLAERVGTERVTHTIGVDVAGIPRLAT